MRPWKWSGLGTQADTEPSRAFAEQRRPEPAKGLVGGVRRGPAQAAWSPRPLRRREERSTTPTPTLKDPGAQTEPAEEEHGPQTWPLFPGELEGRWGRVEHRDQLRRRRQVALTGELEAGLLGRGSGVRPTGRGSGGQACWGGPGPHPRGRPASARAPPAGTPDARRPLCLGAPAGSLPLQRRPGPLGCSGSGRGPPLRVSLAPLSACGEGALRIPGSPQGGPGAGGALPSRETALGAGLGPSPPPRPSHPPVTARAAGASGGASSRRSTSSSRASACLSGGGRGVVGGAGAPAGRPGPAPAPGPGPTFGEQLLLAALQGTDLPGQSPLQHLRERGALSLQLSSWSPSSSAPLGKSSSELVGSCLHSATHSFGVQLLLRPGVARVETLSPSVTPQVPVCLLNLTSSHSHPPAPRFALPQIHQARFPPRDICTLTPAWLPRLLMRVCVQMTPAHRGLPHWHYRIYRLVFLF